MGSNRTRRRFLELVGAGAAVGLAGCTGEQSTGAATGTTVTESETETATDTATTTETETTDETTSEPEDPTMSTVFHFAKPPEEQNHAVANVANLLADESTDVEEVVLVANGKGIYLLTEGESNQAEKVRELISKGVSFRVCENSMEALDVSESDLIAGVETVPAGVGELTKLQARDGYAYIETP
ncbi:DsrE family protein [Haloarchaeobius sp. DFWS5]|uniref:DsrE family protein n=1 Tax=Haloarchaeobius sp. DFWS5 TaxID=3446114 RepID=UPI003EBC44D5